MAGVEPAGHCKLPPGFSPEAASRLRMTKHAAAAGLNAAPCGALINISEFGY